MSAKVFSFAPLDDFDGSYGKWSSFMIRIGSPEQNFRVLPVPSTGTMLVPGPAGCPTRITDLHDCAAHRGVEDYHYTGFQSNDSKTWKPVENPEDTYPVLIAEYLGVQAVASYGTDHVGLMVQNSGGPNLKDQVVGSLRSQHPFFVGFFGLDSKPSTFTNETKPYPSYITNLKSSGQISSLSYGYTAGAYYRTPKALGSLTLGGYDESRLIRNNVTFQFNTNDQQWTSLWLQDITVEKSFSANETRSFLSEKIYVNVDFTLPYLWLPNKTCDRIASLFKLKYDTNHSIYLIDTDSIGEDARSKPTLSFELGPSEDAAESVRIDIPYAALNLEASWPIFNETARFFPMKRAIDSSQYTLGRAFMQEAYMTVDYERGNFSIQKTSFSNLKEERLVPILAIDAIMNDGDEVLSRRSIIGITIGSSCAFVVLTLAAWLFYRHRKRSRTQPDGKVEDHVADSPVAFELTERCEIRSELVGVQVSELRAIPTRRHELPCQ